MDAHKAHEEFTAWCGESGPFRRDTPDQGGQVPGSAIVIIGKEVEDGASMMQLQMAGSVIDALGVMEHRRRHHHCWRRTLPSRGSVVPAKLPASGIHVTSFQSNMECNVYIRKYLYVNVVLSSGTNTVPEVVVPPENIILTVGAKALPCAEVLFHQTFPLRGDPSAKLQEAKGGLAVSPRKPRVPHCEERPGGAASRSDQVCVVGWR